MNTWRSSFIVLCIALAIACIVQIAKQDFGNAIETDVSTLLPHGDSQNAKLARSLINETQGKVIYATLENLPQEEVKRTKAQTELEQIFNNSPLIESITRVDNRTLEETFKYVSNHKFHLLFPKWYAKKKEQYSSEEIGSEFETWAASQAVQELEEFFESPEAMQLSSDEILDPLLLNIGAIRAFSANQNLKQLANSQNYWIRITGSPLRKSFQEDIAKLFNQSETALASISPEVTLKHGGLIRLASASRERIHNDIVKINVISVLGVILCSSLLINRPWHLIKALPTIIFAFLGSTAACFFFFGSVHMIALVIGSILTGISIDYAFHMLFQSDAKVPTRKLIFFACLSTIAGAVTLSSSSLLLIKQIGVFTAFGLIFAFAYSQTLTKASWQKSSSLKRLSLKNGRSLFTIAISVIVIVSSMGFFRLSWNDDIRLMEAADKKLQAEDTELRKNFGGSPEGRVYLAIGDSYLDSLNHAQEFIDSIATDHSSLNLFSPSLIFSNQNDVSDVIDSSESLKRFFETLRETLNTAEFDPDAFENFFKAAYAFAGSKFDFAIFENHLVQTAQTISGPLEGIINQSDTIYTSAISLKSTEPIQFDSPNIATLSNLDFINEVLNTYRSELIRFGLIAMGIVALFIIVSFGPKVGIIIVSIPLTSVGLSLGISSLFASDLNIFHVTGAFLAMALALDYSLFAVNSISQKRPIPFSVYLSAATTGSSFLALVFSAIPVVQSLGIVVFASTITCLSLIQCFANFSRTDERSF